MDPKKKQELRTRLIIGPTLAALILLLFWLDITRVGGWLAAVAMGLVSLAGVREYVVMVRGAGHPIAGGLLMIAATVLHASALFFGWHDIDHEFYPPIVVTLALLFPLSLRAMTREHFSHGMEEMGFTLLGLILLSWPFYLAQGIALRVVSALAWAMIVCKMSDTGAYFTGVAFGRRKLIPHVSPGKSVEGAIGGVVVAALVAALLRGPLLAGQMSLSLTGALLTGIMLSVTTQVGDLVESLLKRRCGVKDSSQLLPAHGGILDLVDSFIFSIPAFMVVVVRWS